MKRHPAQRIARLPFFPHGRTLHPTAGARARCARVPGPRRKQGFHAVGTALRVRGDARRRRCQPKPWGVRWWRQ
jgi:hypothetical protein